MDLSRMLAGSAEAFRASVEEVKSKTFENPPDGTYIAMLTGAEVCESQAGKMQTKWSFTFVEGDLSGKTKYDWIGLEGTRGFEPLIWRLQQLDVDPSEVDISKLQELMDELVEDEIVVRFQLKTTTSQDGREFQNIKNMRILPGYEVSDVGQGDQEETLTVGMRVSISVDGKKKLGVVTEINEAQGLVGVKVGQETHVVSVGDISL